MSCASCNGSDALQVSRGESATFLLTVKNLTTKQPIDITGAKVWFTVKSCFDDVGAIIAKKNLAAGGVDGQILITSPQTGLTVGQVQVYVDPADTASLDPEASYVCDAWVQMPSNKRYQVVSNRQFIVAPVVTTSF